MWRTFLWVGGVLRVVVTVVTLGLRPQLRIAVTKEVTAPLETTGSIVAILVRKGWGWGDFSIVGGTVELRPPVSPHFIVNPLKIVTTAAAPDAIFTIHPSSLGSGNVQVWGESTFGNHGQGWFSSGPWVRVTVTQ